MTAPATAETVARHLELTHARLVALHADAEAARLPQGVVMGLHWLCEDAASVLAHLHGMLDAERKAERAVMAAKREAPPA